MVSTVHFQRVLEKRSDDLPLSFKNFRAEGKLFNCRDMFIIESKSTKLAISKYSQCIFSIESFELTESTFLTGYSVAGANGQFAYSETRLEPIKLQS